AAHHQRFVDIGAQADDRLAAHNVRIEAVERAENADREAPALRRVRVDEGKVLEAGRHGRLAMHGDGGAWLSLSSSHKPQQGSTNESNAAKRGGHGITLDTQSPAAKTMSIRPYSQGFNAR